jgi:hypothetical protein
MHRRWILGAVLTLALAAAACSDGDGLTADREEPTTRRRVSTTTSTSTTSTTTTTTTTVPPTTIVEIVEEIPVTVCPDNFEFQATAALVLDRWAVGDRAGAAACATPGVVDELFAMSPSPQGYSFYECTAQNEFVQICAFTTAGGAHSLIVEADSENSRTRVVAYQFQGG